MNKIAGIPTDELAAFVATSQEMKLRAYEIALDVAKMSPETRSFTGFRDAEHVILDTAVRIERALRALEKKYPA